MANRLGDTNDAEMALIITRLRESSGVSEALVFTGNGRLVAFSSSAYGQLFPDVPPSSVINQLRISGGYSAAEVDEVPEEEDVAAAPSTHLPLRLVVPVSTPDRFSSSMGVSPELLWPQLIQRSDMSSV